MVCTSRPASVGVWPLLALVVLLPLIARADEARVRGDLAARSSDLSQLLELGLEDGDAAALFKEVRQALLLRLGTDAISEAELYLGAVHGMLEVVRARRAQSGSALERALPPSAMVLSATQTNELRRDLAGQMTGIGIDFRLFPDHGLMLVMDVMDGSPGDRAGIQAGDRIVAVDDQGFSGAGVNDVLGMLQGGVGTPVRLRVVRSHGTETRMWTVSLSRAEFPVRSVRDDLTPDGIGWLHVAQFHAGTVLEMQEAVGRLRKLGADRLVLDLRHSQGGDLRAAARVAGLFLPKSAVIVRVIEPGVGEEDLVAAGPQEVTEPTVVLVDRWTHGAAEAVANALQEHARAYVIGERTMGAARLETLIPLRPGLTLRLDSVRLESPTGKSWQGVGVEPDQSVLVEGGPALGVPDGAPGSDDQQLRMAVQYLQTESE